MTLYTDAINVKKTCVRKRSIILLLVFLIAVTYYIVGFRTKEIIIPQQGAPIGLNITQQQRQAFASDLEQKFRGRGMEARIKIDGEDGKTLHIKWIKLSKPLISAMATNPVLIGSFRELGFKKLKITDGFMYNYDVDLKN